MDHGGGAISERGDLAADSAGVFGQEFVGALLALRRLEDAGDVLP